MEPEVEHRNLVELSFPDYVQLLISRKPLERIQDYRRDWSLRGALLEPRTGTIYVTRLRTDCLSSIPATC